MVLKHLFILYQHVYLNLDFFKNHYIFVGCYFVLFLLRLDGFVTNKNLCSQLNRIQS